MLAVLGEHVMNLILLCYVALIVQFFKKFLTLGWFFGVHFAELAYGPFGFFSILQELVLWGVRLFEGEAIDIFGQLFAF